MASLHRNDSPQVSDGKWSVSYGDEGSSLVQIEHGVLLIEDLQRPMWKCSQRRSEFTIQSRFVFTIQTVVLRFNTHRHSSYYREKKTKNTNKTLFRCVVIIFSSALLWLKIKSGKRENARIKCGGCVGSGLLPWLSTQPHSQMTPRITSDYGLFKSGLKSTLGWLNQGAWIKRRRVFLLRGCQVT